MIFEVEISDQADAGHMPERFRKYEKEPWHSRGLHIIPVDNYCVLYIPDMEKAVVSVIV